MKRIVLLPSRHMDDIYCAQIEGVWQFNVTYADQVKLGDLFFLWPKGEKEYFLVGLVAGPVSKEDIKDVKWPSGWRESNRQIPIAPIRRYMKPISKEKLGEFGLKEQLEIKTHGGAFEVEDKDFDELVAYLNGLL